MEAPAAIASAVEPTSTVAPTAVEAASTATVGASASAPMTAAMLGNCGDGQANEDERSETCKKSLEQGGFPHMSSLHRNSGRMPRRADRLY